MKDIVLTFSIKSILKAFLVDRMLYKRVQDTIMSLPNGYSNPKERCVVECRREGMTYPKIAKECMISVRDIKPILLKYGTDNVSGCSDNEVQDHPDSLMSISSRAYKLFHDEMVTPIEVAVRLNISAQDAMRYYYEYLELNNKGSLAKLLKGLSDEEISWLLRLCAVANSKRIGISQIIEFYSVYTEDLPMVKQQYQDAECELQVLLKQIYQSELKVEFLDSRLEKLDHDLGSKLIECEKADKVRMEIIGQTLRLRRFVSEFKNSNLTYEEIEQFVEDKVDSIIRDNMLPS